MKYYLLTLLICTSIIGFSQTQSNSNPTIIIGIGNSDASLNKNVLKFLEKDPSIKVHAVCHTHNIIEFKIIKNSYKDYDTFKDLLEKEYQDIQLYKQDDSIEKDCCNNVKKQ